MAFLSARMVALLAKQLPKHANKVPNRCLITSYIGSRNITEKRFDRRGIFCVQPIPSKMMMPFARGLIKRCFCSSRDCNQLADHQWTEIMDSTLKELQEEINRVREGISQLGEGIRQLGEGICQLKEQNNQIEEGINKLREESIGLFQLAQLVFESLSNDDQFTLLETGFPDRDPLPIKHESSLVENPHTIDMTMEEEKNGLDLVAELSQDGKYIKDLFEAIDAEVDRREEIQSRFLNSLNLKGFTDSKGSLINEETGSTT